MPTSIISLEDVVHLHKNKTNQVNLFKDINLNIDRYSCMALLSYPLNDAGALLRCINLSDKPKSGTICINNDNIKLLDKNDVRKIKSQISLIMANPNLLSSKTVAENVALPLTLNNIAKNEIVSRTEASLAITGLTHKTHSPIDLLSNLDKCKVALARAIVNNPKILLLDNATKTLDTKATCNYINLVNIIKNKLKLTVLVATDNLDVAKNLCDQIVIISDGNIVEITSPEAIALNPGSAVAKELTKRNARQELPFVIKKKLSLQKTNNSKPITRIAFTAAINPEIVLSELMQTTGVAFNILQAYQELLGDKSISVIIAEIVCNGKNLDIVKSYLEDHKLYMEILGYV